MNEFFGPDGLFAQRLPDYEYRPSQARMAEAVQRALEGRTHAMIEAGTGTGKTLAYLLPALLHGERVMVSTGTRALQDQIFYKDIPLLEHVLERPIRSAYLKGRSNYLCRVKLSEARNEGLFSASDLRVFQKIEGWAAQTETGDRAELSMLEDNSELWSRIDASRDRCQGSKCAEFERCFLTMNRQRALEADIVVVNHHLFFADLAVRESEMAAILPDYTTVIFDEAHDLEDVATEYFGFHVSNFRLAELARDARALAKKSEADIEDEVQMLQRAADRFFDGFALMREGRQRLPELNGIEFLIGSLSDIKPRFKALKDFSGDWEALARRSGEIADELTVFRDGTPENYVSWIERRGRGVFLEACPVNVARLLSERLFDRVPSCVLTSATLTVGNSFEYLRRRVGLREGEELCLATEFNLESQALLYIPKQLPDYRDPSYLAAATDEIRGILRASEGRAFVLFTSYQQMQAAFKILEPALPYPCLIQGSGSRTRLLDRFRRTSNAVLFATSSFWQGIDVKGDSLSAVIIDKLPFQVPSDPLVEARIREVEESGGSAFGEYQVPAAILRLKQGFGRLIRSRTDRGILAILDSRLRTKPYGRLFVSSLPGYAVTDSVADLGRFMKHAWTVPRESD